MSVRAPNQKYTKEILQEAIKQSFTWKEVMAILNPDAHYRGSLSHIRNLAKKYGISNDHFPGQAWRKGKTFPKEIKLDDLFQSSTIGSSKLKQKLFEQGVKIKQCERCLATNWLDGEIPLELHHIDHNNKNNKLENLQILCANCHAFHHSEVFRKQKVVTKQRSSIIKKIIPIVKNKKCQLCGDPSHNKYCSQKCSHIVLRKVTRPDKEELQRLINTYPFTHIAKTFNVSDNCIRKWCVYYNIQKQK